MSVLYCSVLFMFLNALTYIKVYVDCMYEHRYGSFELMSIFKLTPYRISWIIFTLDLVIDYQTKSHLLDNIYIRFGNRLYRQIVGIPMGTNFAPLVADLI